MIVSKYPKVVQVTETQINDISDETRMREMSHVDVQVEISPTQKSRSP